MVRAEEWNEWADRLRSASAAVPRFRVDQELERTGSSVSFRGWDEALAREIMVKTVDEERDRPHGALGPADQRLITEALVTGQMSHPGIAPVHELALDARGRPYFTTRLLRGTTLREVIAKSARGGRDERGFTLARTIDALRGACDTIAYAHSRGVTHGDLSPERIIVGEFGETCVTGWGSERAARPEEDVRAAGELLAQILAARTRPAPPPELAAICRKAMTREAPDRYAGMGEMSADLRAWLERRVVRAHRTGALAEFQKWVARNKLTAALSTLALVVAIAGLSRADAIARARNRELSATRDRIASSLADVRRLKALKSVRDLVPKADAIWPAVPAEVAAMRRWLADAQALVDERPLHMNRLADLEAHGRRDAVGAWSFDDPRAAWWHESLEQLVASLDELAAETPFRIGSIAEMKRRIARAESVAKRSRDDASAEWRDAIAGIEADPRFRDVRIGEQLGLVPIGRDPASGLWEFFDVDSGERPQRDPKSGRIVVTESMALVFVLLPGVTLHFEDSEDVIGLPTFDPAATSSPERRPEFRDVALDPFFISKFEMTQGEWLHVTGGNPSGHAPGVKLCRMHHDLTHPVELVSFETASATMRRLGWTLPTYAQWQYASRAGTPTRFWTGDDAATLEGAANIADSSFVTHLSGRGAVGEVWNDGYFCTAPVGSFRPNPFGLHDTIGNVEEMCGEPSYKDDAVDFSPGDGRRRPRGKPAGADLVLVQGGSFGRTSSNCTYGSFVEFGIGAAADSVGLRPARALSRLPADATSRPR